MKDSFRALCHGKAFHVPSRRSALQPDAKLRLKLFQIDLFQRHGTAYSTKVKDRLN